MTDPGQLLNANERRIANDLAVEGRRVTARSPSNVHKQRTSDVYMDGHHVEFKTLRPDGHATDSRLRNTLTHGKGQSSILYVEARGSGLTVEDTERGIWRAVKAHPDRYTAVRVRGDGYDLVWEPT